MLDFVGIVGCISFARRKNSSERSYFARALTLGVIVLLFRCYDLKYQALHPLTVFKFSSSPPISEGRTSMTGKWIFAA